MVNRSLELLEKRNKLLRGVCDIHDNSQAGFYTELSPRDRKNTLLEAMTTGFESTRVFEDEVSRTAHQVNRYAESIPAVPSDNATPVSQSPSTRRSLSGRKSRHRLTPVALAAPIGRSRNIPAEEPKNKNEKWARIEQTMRRTRAGPVPTKKLARMARIGASSTNLAPTNQRRIAGASGPSLLLSPAERVPLNSA